MPPQLPRVTIRKDVIMPADVASAASMVRINSRIVNLSWDFRPTVGIVARDVDRLGIDIRSFREPLTRAIKQIMIPSFRKNFAAGGRPAWEPLTEATIKLRGYSAWPILVRSGALRKAATTQSIWDIGVTSAVIRKLPARVWYGALHQEGYGGFGKVAEAARKKLGPKATNKQVNALAFKMIESKGKAAAVVIPERPFIVMQPEDAEGIERVFAEWLGERAARVGRFG